MSDRLTLNLGLRYDVTDWPREGHASDHSNITGNIDLNNGTYVFQDPAPACSSTQGAPCIPGGTLPDHVTVSPNGRIIQNTYDNIQPRLGSPIASMTRLSSGLDMGDFMITGLRLSASALTSRKAGPTSPTWPPAT